MWTQQIVFEAAVRQCGGREINNPNTGFHFVQLYPQTTNCALLYADPSKFKKWPLHLNPGQPSWEKTTYKRLVKVIGKAKFLDGFFICEVIDWDEFAKALKLAPI